MRSNRYFLLAMLTGVGVLNFVDRQILSILLEAIKEDLAFSDVQLGLLSGTLFAVFYSIVGIPVARLADRWDRFNCTIFMVGNDHALRFGNLVPPSGACSNWCCGW